MKQFMTAKDTLPLPPPSKYSNYASAPPTCFEHSASFLTMLRNKFLLLKLNIHAVFQSPKLYIPHIFTSLPVASAPRELVGCLHSLASAGLAALEPHSRVWGAWEVSDWKMCYPYPSLTWCERFGLKTA